MWLARVLSKVSPAVPVAALAALVMGAGASCAAHMGKKTSEGFMQGLRNQQTENPDEQPMRVMAGRIVGGGLEALDDPQQMARVRALTLAVADEAVRGAFAALGDPEQQRQLRGLMTGAANDAVASALAAFDDPRQQARLRTMISSMVEDTVASALRGATVGENGERAPAAALAGEIARAATKDAMQEVTAGLSASLTELFPGCQGRDAAQCRRQRLRDLTREAGAGFSAGVLESFKWPMLFGAGLLGLLLGLLTHWLWTRRPSGHGPIVSSPRGAGLRQATSSSGP